MTETTNPTVLLLEQANIDCNRNFPGGHLKVEPGFAQIISINGKASAANAVYRSIFSEESAEQKIADVCARYRAMAVSFRWVVTPLTQPLNTAELLQANGLTLLYTSKAMIKSSASAIVPYDARIQIRQATLQDAEIYIETFLSAWELPTSAHDEFRTDVMHILTTTGHGFLPFLAFYDGVPAGTGGLIVLPGGAYLASGTVKKEFRGQGVYRALLSHRASVAVGLGLMNLLIHAKSHTAAPICTKLGFETVYEQQVFSVEI